MQIDANNEKQENVFENDVWNGTFAMNFITVSPYLNM